MSLQKIKSVFSNVSGCDIWSLQLLSISYSSVVGTDYYSHELVLSPPNALAKLVDEIVKRYLDGDKCLERTYEDMRQYDSSGIGNVIYKLDTNDDLIEWEYRLLLEAISNPDVECDPFTMKAKAYMISGLVPVDGQIKSVKMVSMHSPIVSLKHRYFKTGGTFKEVSDKVLALRTDIDVIIIDETIYMLTLDGEKLFNMERSYKIACESRLDDIDQLNIIAGSDIFRERAAKGFNPRRFVSFNDESLRKLEDVDNREMISGKFGIGMTKEGKFDIDSDSSADKFIKVLCNRAMLDPFDSDPMEVAGSKKWV